MLAANFRLFSLGELRNIILKVDFRLVVHPKLKLSSTSSIANFTDAIITLKSLFSYLTVFAWLVSQPASSTVPHTKSAPATGYKLVSSNVLS